MWFWLVLSSWRCSFTEKKLMFEIKMLIVETTKCSLPPLLILLTLRSVSHTNTNEPCMRWKKQKHSENWKYDRDGCSYCFVNHDVLLRTLAQIIIESTLKWAFSPRIDSIYNALNIIKYPTLDISSRMWNGMRSLNSNTNPLLSSFLCECCFAHTFHTFYFVGCLDELKIQREQEYIKLSLTD